MADWVAIPIVRGRPAKNGLGQMKGRHRTVDGRVNYIRERGRPGVSYAVAVKLDVGWVDVDPVTVPRQRDSK
jgi:hypothetical protein